MDTVYEILSLAVMFLAGNLSGQVAPQMRDSKKVAVGSLLILVFTGVGIGLAMFLDKRLAMLDYVFWAGVYVFGFILGWRAKA